MRLLVSRAAPVWDAFRCFVFGRSPAYGDSMASALEVRASDFVLRSSLPSKEEGLSVLTPGVLERVVRGVARAGRPLGLMTNQVQAELDSPKLAERYIDIFYPEPQLLVRLALDRIELSTSKLSRRARELAIELFDALVVELGSGFGLENGATTSWNLHVAGDDSGFFPTLPQGPALGSPAKGGVVFNYGAAPWDDSVVATALILEPSAAFEQALFIGLRNVWRPDTERLSARFARHVREVQRVAEVDLREAVA